MGGGDNLVSEKPYRSSYYYCLFNLSKNGLKKLSNILCSNQFLKAKSEVMFWNLIKYSKYLWKCNLMCLRDRDYAMFQPSYRTICAALLCWKHWCFSCWRLYKQMNILMWNLSTVKEIIQNTVQEIIQCSKKKLQTVFMNLNTVIKQLIVTVIQHCGYRNRQDMFWSINCFI